MQKFQRKIRDIVRIKEFLGINNCGNREVIDHVTHRYGLRRGDAPVAPLTFRNYGIKYHVKKKRQKLLVEAKGRPLVPQEGLYTTQQKYECFPNMVNASYSKFGNTWTRFGG